MWVVKEKAKEGRGGSGSKVGGRKKCGFKEKRKEGEGWEWDKVSG